MIEPPPPADHVRDAVLAQEVGRLQAHVHAIVPSLLVQLGHRSAPPPRVGVAHQHIQPPVGGHGKGDQRLDLVAVRHVGGVILGHAALLTDLGHHLLTQLAAAAVDHHLGALAGELDRCGLADARGGARHNRHLAL